MSERERMKVERMELQKKRLHTILTTEALRKYMRELLYVLIEPDDLEGEKIFMLAMQLKEKAEELTKNKEQLAILTRELDE